MSITQCMTLRARHARSSRLGQCLARLDGMGQAATGCLELRIYPLVDDPLAWRVEGRWCSCAARDAFLLGEALRRVLAEAIGEDLIASLECECEGESPQQVA